MRNFTAGEERNTEHRGTAVGGQTRPRPLFGNYQTGFSLTVTHISSRSSPPPLFEAVSPTPPFFVNAFNYPLGWKGHRSSQCRCPEVCWQFWNYCAKSGFGPLFRPRVESLFCIFFQTATTTLRVCRESEAVKRKRRVGGSGWLGAIGWESVLGLVIEDHQDVTSTSRVPHISTFPPNIFYPTAPLLVLR